MTKSAFNTLILVLASFTSCLGQTRANTYHSCDINLRFELGRNSAIQFYDSTGAESWTWKNDSIDFIYSYFQVKSSFDNLVRIDTVMILNGENENNSHGWELENVEGNETVKQLEGSWIKLNDCRTNLSEWMLYGNYKDPYTPYIYERPDTNSTRNRFDPRDGWTDHEIKILKVTDTWLYVELTLKNDKKFGWMPSYNLCSHPHTTCN